MHANEKGKRESASVRKAGEVAGRRKKGEEKEGRTASKLFVGYM
jgi:hypothetical protein